MAQPRTKHWVRISYKGDGFSHPGAALAKAWKALHRGDREPFPDARRVAALLAGFPAAGVPGLKPAVLAGRVQEAWRAFHAGEFEQAFAAGSALGALGAAVAAKAATVYVSYLEEDDRRAEALLGEAVRITAAAAGAAPGYANAHYFHAYALGRLSQRMSVLKALAAGHAPRIRGALEATLRLEPEHADAEIALGLWHAEIVGKLGVLAARLSYGATPQSARTHLRRALALDPCSPIAHIEHANGLLALGGGEAEGAARALYEQAVALEPQDAMQWLDIEQARAELG